MSIKLLDNEDLWDRLVEESPYGMLFHRWKFLQILEKYSGFRLYPFGVFRGDEPVCLFPCFTGPTAASVWSFLRRRGYACRTWARS